MDTEKPVTDLLAAWAGGDQSALDEVVALVYTELYRAARQAMSGEHSSHTLNPTALVNEVYLRLITLQSSSWQARGAFFAFAARLMRNILVDHARSKAAEKRWGQAERVALTHPDLREEAPDIDIFDLNNALIELEAKDPTMVKIIDMRYFTGATEEETAAALGVSRATVQRDWSLAKRFLADRLRS